MTVERAVFGEIVIDGRLYTKDLVVDRGSVEKRKKKRSKPYRSQYGHTPLSIQENIPWDCRRLVVGCGFSRALPVMEEVVAAAERKGVELILTDTREALSHLNDRDTNLILHLTC